MSPALASLRAAIEPLYPNAHIYRARRDNALTVEIKAEPGVHVRQKVAEALPAAHVVRKTERRMAHGSFLHVLEIRPADEPDELGGEWAIAFGGAA